jgi:predicted phosphodiesterase
MNDFTVNQFTELRMQKPYLISLKRMRFIVLLLILLLLTHSALAGILAGPYLQNPTQTSITVRWISDDGGSSLVFYGPNLKYSAKGSDGRWFDKLRCYLHEVTITLLKPNSRYPYKVQSGGTRSAAFTFKTAPESNTPISFLAISDAQMKPDLPMTVAAIDKWVQPELIIFSGDLVDRPERVTDWFGGERSFFDVFTGKQPGAPILQNVPLFPSLGNHEYAKQPRTEANLDESKNLEVYLALFSLPGNERYYSHDYGNTHFAHLNVSRSWTLKPKKKPRLPLGDSIAPGSPQFNWLANDLAQTNKKWTVVSLHQPIFGLGTNTDPPYSVPKKNLFGQYTYPKDILYDDLRILLEKNKVDLVIWGHNHVYQHFYHNGIHYIEASSIGNTYGFKEKESHNLVPVYKNSEDRSFAFVKTSTKKMTVTVYRATDGEVLESFEIQEK